MRSDTHVFIWRWGLYYSTWDLVFECICLWLASDFKRNSILPKLHINGHVFQVFSLNFFSPAHMSCSGSAPLERRSTDSGSCVAFIVIYTVHQDKASDGFGAKYSQSWMDVVLAILWGFVIRSCEQELVLSVAVSLHLALLHFSRPELSFLLYLPHPFQHLCRIDVSCDSHFLVPLITYNPINSCLNYNPRHSILEPWSTFEHEDLFSQALTAPAIDQCLTGRTVRWLWAQLVEKT